MNRPNGTEIADECHCLFLHVGCELPTLTSIVQLSRLVVMCMNGRNLGAEVAGWGKRDEVLGIQGTQ